MNNDDEKSNALHNAVADLLDKQRRDDLAAEIGGYDNGRIHQILSGDTADAIREKRNGKDEKKLSAFELAMLNAEYAALFHTAENNIDTAQHKATAFDEKVHNAIDEMQQRVEKTLDAAVTLPNGKKAFMNKDGEVYTVDGERVDQAIVDGIDWTDRPTLEEYQEQLHRLEKLKELAHEGDRLGLHLADLDNELHGDPPPKKDRVKGIADKAKSIADKYDRLDKEVDLTVKPEQSTDVDAPSAQNLKLGPLSGL